VGGEKGGCIGRELLNYGNTTVRATFVGRDESWTTYCIARPSDCIWLAAEVSPARLRDGGYDLALTLNAIHPTYGTSEDFSEAFNPGRAYRMRVIADLVMNHTSGALPVFPSRALSAPAGSPDRDWVRSCPTRRTSTRTSRSSFITDTPRRRTGTGTPVARPLLYYGKTALSHQPDLNIYYNHPAVHEAMWTCCRSGSIAPGRLSPRRGAYLYEPRAPTREPRLETPRSSCARCAPTVD